MAEVMKWLGVGEGTDEGKRRSATYLSLIAFILMVIALDGSVPLISGEFARARAQVRRSC